MRADALLELYVLEPKEVSIVLTQIQIDITNITAYILQRQQLQNHTAIAGSYKIRKLFPFTTQSAETSNT